MLQCPKEFTLDCRLYFSNFIDEPGEPVRGKRLFKEKGCLTCHETADGEVPVGLDASKMKLQDAPSVIAAMWNHAPVMGRAILGETLEQIRHGPLLGDAAL